MKTEFSGNLPPAVYVVIAGSVMMNVALLLKLALGSTASIPEAPAEIQVAAAEVVAPAEDLTINGEVPDLQEAMLLAAEAKAKMPSEVFSAKATVTHSLARTFQGAAKPGHADVVAAVFARLFVWRLDLRKDLQKGDALKVAYTWDGELAHIPVASYTSSKLGKEVSAYEFKIEGDTFTSWWDAEGNEMSKRLAESPLANYEQITSLIKDRPKHKGMDFKAPVGTEVTSPRAGVVTRINWNFANNGNCVEVKYKDGTFARFLHLSETGVKAGEAVAAGARVGAVGNTGHSTAAHLHYELEKGGKVMDPINYHGTILRSIPENDRDRFGAERRALDALLNESKG